MKARDTIARMGTYDPPLEARQDGEAMTLDFNESTLPPPPQVIEALVSSLREGGINRYPQDHGLMQKLAAYTGVGPEQIILTNGSDQALDITLRALLEAGDEMVFAQPGFAMIPQIASVQGACTVGVPYRPDMTFPYEEMLAAVSPRTRLIALVNPNNPTGTAIAPAEIESILAAHPDIPVLVDEAYFEFTGESSVSLLSHYDNLVITRTFSKAFALAGLRLGYVLGDAPFIRELYKVRGPFDVNTMAMKAAEAVLDFPEAWHAYVDEVMTRAKPMVERFFDEHGVAYTKGAANFMLVRTDDRDTAVSYLREHGILVRPQKPPIGDTFRLSVGTVADMNRFMQVYADYLAGAPAQARQAREG